MVVPRGSADVIANDLHGIDRGKPAVTHGRPDWSQGGSIIIGCPHNYRGLTMFRFLFGTGWSFPPTI